MKTKQRVWPEQAAHRPINRLCGEGGGLISDVRFDEETGAHPTRFEKATGAQKRRLVGDGKDHEMGMYGSEYGEVMDGLGHGVAGLNELLLGG